MDWQLVIASTVDDCDILTSEDESHLRDEMGIRMNILTGKDFGMWQIIDLSYMSTTLYVLSDGHDFAFLMLRPKEQ